MNPLGRVVCSAILLTGLVAGAGAPASRAQQATDATEAPAGFDGRTNGLVDQATYDADLALFAKVETPADGLGPVYNAASCAECHANPIAGGSSQVLELRAGHFDGTSFVAHPGGSLIQSRATDASLQERILDGYEVRTFRASSSTLGLGYVEAIDDRTFAEIADDQRRETNGRVAGEMILVPVLESPGVVRVGRFGWKCQHASLVSFAADAYLNEMGVTTPLFPTENTSNGRTVAAHDPLPDPDEGDLDDVEAFATFMRATAAPPRDSGMGGRDDAPMGEQLFGSTGCAVCHVPSIRTAPVGTTLGSFVVPEALGDTIIHPYGDFLLHDVGTGDGIPDDGFPDTRNKIRTAPLWGLRTRNRFMHDGATLTIAEAIARHGGEARQAARQFARLDGRARHALLEFLESL
jgi:CxxC motif-containing protein (DUF1111 family)